MARRRRKSSPFSLFSFQDIITSVTAVIILLTLILTLELVTRKSTSAAQQLDHSVADLKSALEKAEQERELLESRLKLEASRTIEQASTTSESLKRDLEQTQQQVARLRRELHELRQRQTTAQQQEDSALARSLDMDARRKEYNDLKTHTSAAESEVDQLAKGDHLIFNRPTGTSKRPWLVDVSEEAVIVLSFPPDEDRFEFRSQLLTTCVDQLLTWARENCTAGGDYFVLLIRPSGIKNANLLRDSLSSRGFEIGRDAVGTTQKVTVGKRKPQTL